MFGRSLTSIKASRMKARTLACDQRDFSYHVWIANYLLNDLGTHHSLLRFALGPRGVVATFMLKREALLSCIRCCNLPAKQWLASREESGLSFRCKSQS